MSLLRRFRALTFIIALALVATACGGGSDDSSDDPTTTSTVAGGGGDNDGGSSASTTTTPTTAPAQVSGDSGSGYCDRIRDTSEGDQDGLDFNPLGKTPQQLQALFEANLEVFEGWENLAPDEIKDDAAVIIEAFRGIVERANELEWDLQALASDPAFNAFDSAEVTAAADNLDAYSRDVCGVDFSTLGDSGAAPGPGGDEPQDAVTILMRSFGIPAGFFSDEAIECLRQALGPEFEAKITADYVLTAEDTLLLADAFEVCEISLG